MGRARIGFVVVAVILGVLKGYFRSSDKPEKELAKAAAMMNAECPKDIDEDTRMDKVTSGPGLRLTFHYTLVNAIAEEIDLEEMKKILKPTMVEELKGESEMDTVFEEGVTLSYTYADKNGASLITIDITPKDMGY